MSRYFVTNSDTDDFSIDDYEGINSFLKLSDAVDFINKRIELSEEKYPYEHGLHDETQYFTLIKGEKLDVKKELEVVSRVKEIR